MSFVTRFGLNDILAFSNGKVATLAILTIARQGTPIQHIMVNMVRITPVAEPKNFRNRAPVYPISAAISNPSMIMTLERSMGFRNVSTMATESVG